MPTVQVYSKLKNKKNVISNDSEKTFQTLHNRFAGYILQSSKSFLLLRHRNDMNFIRNPKSIVYCFNAGKFLTFHIFEQSAAAG